MSLNEPMQNGIVFSQEQWRQMQDVVVSQVPDEACGLVAGRIEENRYIVTEVIPTTNIDHSPVRFRIDPHQQLEAFNHIESQNWILAGVFHSHPNGPDIPSSSDIAQAFYPESVTLIWSKGKEDWQCRAFIIKHGQVSEIPILVIG